MIISLKDLLFPSPIMGVLSMNGMGVNLTFFCGIIFQSNIIIKNLLLLISETVLAGKCVCETEFEGSIKINVGL